MRRACSARAYPVTLLLALFPLLALLSLTPGTPPFFAAVMLAGALMQVSLPILVVSAQDLAPRTVAAASGMLMGVATGIAGVLYIGIGRLQDLVGLAPAMRLGFLAVIPAALVAYVALTKYRVSADVAVPVVVAGSRCGCAGCACTILAGGDLVNRSCESTPSGIDAPRCTCMLATTVNRGMPQRSRRR